MSMKAHAAQMSSSFPSNVGGFFYTKGGKRTIDQRATLWGCKTKSGMATFLSRKDLGQFLAILSTAQGPRFLTQGEIEAVQEWVRKKRAVKPEPTPAMAAEASAEPEREPTPEEDYIANRRGTAAAVEVGNAIRCGIIPEEDRFPAIERTLKSGAIPSFEGEMQKAFAPVVGKAIKQGIIPETARKAAIAALMDGQYPPTFVGLRQFAADHS